MTTKLYIGYDSDFEITRESDPNDEWSGEDTVTDWSFKYITEEETSDYTTCIEVNYPIEPRTYYMLEAIYSTGDSFSHNESGQIEIIDVFKTLVEAEACKHILSKVRKYGPVKIPTSSNKQLEYIPPWCGYFNGLTSLTIVPVLISTHVENGIAYLQEEQNEE